MRPRSCILCVLGGPALSILPREIRRALLVAAGCTSADIGIDTAAEAVLPGFGKSLTIEDVRDSTAATEAAGMDVCHL